MARSTAVANTVGNIAWAARDCSRTGSGRVQLLLAGANRLRAFGSGMLRALQISVISGKRPSGSSVDFTVC
jgi:hypothetical protein